MLISLQLLRALAAWLVVYHHYMQIFFQFHADSGFGAFFANYGSLGVDVFFVISGFVMYYSLNKKPRTAYMFLHDRIQRIVPAYWFYTLLTLLLSSYYTEFSSAFWTPLSLLQSLLFIPHANPSGLGWFPLLTVGWSLNFEMFFYFLLGVFLAIYPRRAFVLVSVSLLLLPFFWPQQWHYGEFFRRKELLEFVGGIALAYIYLQKMWLHYRLMALLLFIGAMLILHYHPFELGRVIGVTLLTAALLGFERDIQKNHWLSLVGNFLGRISYSTYLVHAIVLAIAWHYVGSVFSPAVEVILLSALTLLISLCSFLSYYLLERGVVWQILKRCFYAREAA